MKKVLIIINGWAESGKDTFEQFVRDELNMQGWATESLSSIKPVWDFLMEPPFNIPMDIKGEKEHNLAAEIKSALNKYDHAVDRMNVGAIWSNHWKARDKANVNFLQFLHVREPESIEFIKNSMNDGTWEIRTLFVQADRVADQNVAKYVYDDTITNNGGLDELQTQAIVYAQKFV